jgi:hypothetical protein
MPFLEILFIIVSMHIRHGEQRIALYADHPPVVIASMHGEDITAYTRVLSYNETQHEVIAPQCASLLIRVATEEEVIERHCVYLPLARMP